MIETVGYVTTITVLIFLFFVSLAGVGAFFRKKEKPAAPKIAGTAIPEIGDGLDIGKWYDIIYSTGDYSAIATERLQRVRILGYVGRESDDGISKMYMRGRWLVVAFADGRRTYLMPHAIVSLQECGPAPDAPL